ncbi:MAG TPA: creatininase family protein [Usitatibacter sp.]|jgi:creatinine amidohydrolase/Fe(II)-dependent formamide hydrolase-like protein|nr:creatininase family protein [Usitatibacter sp.]
MRMLAIAAIALLLATPAARAQSARSVFLEDLTWTEVRAEAKAGKSIILVPIGGTEQSGPHMALGKHNARVRVLAGRIAEALGNALVAPVVAYVPEGSTEAPAGHMRFPGTISIPDDAFEKTLESAARSFRLHGFHDVFFLGDHGGYQKSLERVAGRLNQEKGNHRFRAHALGAYYEASSRGFDQLLASRGFAEDEIGVHAGLADTALTLALVPDMVRTDRIGAPNMGPADGVQGKPARATAELGRLGAELIVQRSVKAIREATTGR